MKVKDYLQRYRDARREIARVQAEIEEVRSQAERITPRYGLEPRGSGADHDKIGTVLARAEVYEKELRLREADAMTLCVETIGFIDRIPSAESRLILTLRYINLLSWREIEERMYLSERSVFRVHGRALREAQEILDFESWQ